MEPPGGHVREPDTERMERAEAEAEEEKRQQEECANRARRRP